MGRHPPLKRTRFQLRLLSVARRQKLASSHGKSLNAVEQSDRLAHICVVVQLAAKSILSLLLIASIIQILSSLLTVPTSGNQPTILPSPPCTQLIQTTTPAQSILT